MSSYGPEFIIYHFSQKTTPAFSNVFGKEVLIDGQREMQRVNTGRREKGQWIPTLEFMEVERKTLVAPTGGGKRLWTRRAFSVLVSRREFFEKKLGKWMIGVHLITLKWFNYGLFLLLMRVWWFRCSENWSSPLFAPLIAARVPWGVCFRQLGAVQGMLRSPNQICLDLGKFQVNELLRCQEESITYQPKLGWNAAACSLFGDCDEGLVERCWKLACDTVKFDGKDGTRCESSM